MGPRTADLKTALTFDMLHVRNILVQSRRLASGASKEASHRPLNLDTLKSMIPAAGYGGALAMLGLYFTDWQLVLQFMPIYNGKFVKAEERLNYQPSSYDNQLKLVENK